MVRTTPPIRMMLASLLLVSTGSGLLGTTLAHAALGACRSDPIVTFSNGIVAHLGADIYDTPSDITNVSYVVHAPIGTTVVSVVYPVDPNNVPQTFTFFADNPAGVWDSYTLVGTMTAGIAVTATADVTGLPTFSAKGMAQQSVHVQVVDPTAQSDPETGKPRPRNKH